MCPRVRLFAAFILLVCTAPSGSIAASLDNYFFQPDNHIYQDPGRYEQEFEEVLFSSADGTNLMGWFVPVNNVPPEDAIGTVIHLHGNGQNMTAHYTFVNWLPENGFNVFTFDYRGYGRSAGSPSREGVYEDSVAALEYLLSRQDIDTSRIIVLGQSLGGAIAINLLGKNEYPQVKGLVTDSAFYSYRQVARDHAGGLKRLFTLFVDDSFSPEQFIANIPPLPHVIIHGTSDAVVPFYHAEKLHELSGEANSLWTVTDGAHTDALTVHRKQVAPRLLAVFRLWLQGD